MYMVVVELSRRLGVPVDGRAQASKYKKFYYSLGCTAAEATARR